MIPINNGYLGKHTFNKLNTTKSLNTYKKTNIFELKRKSQLNKIITDTSGSPDYLAINIYYDTLRSWYVPNKLKLIDGSIVKVNKLKTKGIFISYKKLQELHGSSTETLRKKLVKLEKLGLIKRSFKHRENSITKSYNQLIIYVLKENEHFLNNYGVSLNEISELRPQTNHQYISEKYNINYTSQLKGNIEIESRGGIHTLEDTKELIEPFSREKDRSIGSNFISNYSKKEDSTSSSNNSFAIKPKTLKDFHPLCSEDCLKLQSLSGRSFSLNAMNEILQDMAERLKDKFFYSNKGFFSYMAKAFSYEMRNENLVSNETFRIKANYTDEENNIIIQEKFLTEIESSLNTSPEWHLKKKLASILERNTAYNILSNYKRIKRVGDRLEIYLAKEIELQESTKENILNNAKSIFNRIGEGGCFEIIEKIDFIFNKNNKNRNTKNQENSSEKLANITDEGEIKKLPLLQKIRKHLMNYQKTKLDSIGVDRAWFSRLEMEETSNKEIKLKAESESCKDYINNNYLNKIEKIVKSLGYSLVSIES